MVRQKCLDVRFFTEMEVRREVMFEKMNDEIADQHKEIGAMARQNHRLGKDLENGRGQHETGARAPGNISGIGATIPDGG